MSEYAYKTIRWPFEVAAGYSFAFRHNGGGAPSSQTITAGTYICDGSNSVSAPIDYVNALETEINDAIAALAIGGSVTGNLTDEGKIRMRWTGGTGNLTVTLTTTQQRDMGYASTSFSLPADSETIFAYQAYGQWLPGIDEDYDSGDLQRQIVSEGRNLKGEPRRVVRSYAPWTERVLEWSRIAGGRMTYDRAADSDFATVAGIATAEDNVWEALWFYLTGAVGPYGDNRIYLYTTNDPTTDSREGPYDVILSLCEPGLDGIPAAGHIQGMSSEYYRVKMLLRAIA